MAIEQSLQDPGTSAAIAAAAPGGHGSSSVSGAQPPSQPRAAPPSAPLPKGERLLQPPKGCPCRITCTWATQYALLAESW